MSGATNGSTLTVIGREGCHLCEEATRIVRRVAADLGLRVRERDVDDSPELGRYSDLVPVVLIDDDLHQYWRIDEQQLRDALSPSARRRRWRGR